MTDNNQHVGGGRMRTFDEQDRIIADFPAAEVQRLLDYIHDQLPSWTAPTAGRTIYGYMLVHGGSCSEAVDGLIAELERQRRSHDGQCGSCRP